MIKYVYRNKTKINNLLDNWDGGYGTDKAYMGYQPFYERYFKPIKDKNIKLLEIGVQKGGSLRLWRDYLPKSQIYGIDIVGKFRKESGDRIQVCAPVDAGSREDLSKLIDDIGGDFDIMIDDGSHCMYDHQVSLGFLFKHLKPGGIFAIEDLSCQDFIYNFNTAMKMNRRRTKDELQEIRGKKSKEGEPTYSNSFFDDLGYIFDIKNNTIDMIKNFNEFGLINSKYMLTDEITYLNKNIEEVKLYDTESIMPDSKRPQQIAFFVKKG